MNGIGYGLSAFVYLWTRDAEMPINQETESYIVGQLKAIKQTTEKSELIFSDKARIDMAIRIIEAVGMEAVKDLDLV